MSSSHALWLNRDALPKLQSRCRCGWRGGAWERATLAFREGDDHLLDTLGVLWWLKEE